MTGFKESMAKHFAILFCIISVGPMNNYHLVFSSNSIVVNFFTFKLCFYLAVVIIISFCKESYIFQKSFSIFVIKKFNFLWPHSFHLLKGYLLHESIGLIK